MYKEKFMFLGITKMKLSNSNITINIGWLFGKIESSLFLRWKGAKFKLEYGACGAAQEESRKFATLLLTLNPFKERPLVKHTLNFKTFFAHKPFFDLNRTRSRDLNLL